MYPLPIQDRDAFFKLDIESSVSPSNRGLGSGQKPFTQALEVDHWQRADPLQCGFRGAKEVMLRPPQAPPPPRLGRSAAESWAGNCQQGVGCRGCRSDGVGHGLPQENPVPGGDRQMGACDPFAGNRIIRFLGWSYFLC